MKERWKIRDGAGSDGENPECGKPASERGTGRFVRGNGEKTLGNDVYTERHAGRSLRGNGAKTLKNERLGGTGRFIRGDVNNNNGRKENGMGRRRGMRGLSIFLTVMMVLTLLPSTTMTANAEKQPTDAKTAGKGYYPEALWNTALYGKDEPTGGSTQPLETYGTEAYWNLVAPNHELTTSFSASQILSGVYFINSDVTVPTPTTGKSGLVVSGNAVLVFESGGSLTVTGADANGRIGAGAGIQLTSGNTLAVFGKGTINATGGNAANGSNGEKAGQWTGGNGGAGGGGAGAGVGSKGADGGTFGALGTGVGSGKVAGKAGGIGGTSVDAGTLALCAENEVDISVTPGAAGTAGGTGGDVYSYTERDRYNVLTTKYNCGGGGGGGGAGGAAKTPDLLYSYTSAGGYGGGGGGGGSAGMQSMSLYQDGGAGGGGAGAVAGEGGAKVTKTQISDLQLEATDATAGGTGAGASGGTGGYVYGNFNVCDGGKGGNAGSYGSNGTTTTVWPVEECVFEFVTEGDTTYSSDNDAWMYDGNAITPKVKITHIPSGNTKIVGANTDVTTGISYANNIYGAENGYGSITIKGDANGVKLLDVSKGAAYSDASVTLYFPIKTEVQFYANAEDEINQLKSDGFSDDEAKVTDMPDAKILQRGVTEITDKELATASVPKLEGYTFLGWYYYNDTYVTGNNQLNENALDSDKKPTGALIFDSLGKVNEASTYLNTNKTWNGYDSTSTVQKPITKLYAIWKQADLSLTLDAQGGQGGSSKSGIKTGNYELVLAPTKPGSTFDGYYTDKNGGGDLYCYVDKESGDMLYRYTVQGDSGITVEDTTYAKGKEGFFTAAQINTDNGGKGSGLKMKKSLYLYAKWAPLEYDVPLYSYDDGNEAAGDAGSAHLVGTLKNVRYGTLKVPNVTDTAGTFKTETVDNTDYGVLDTDLNMKRNHYDFIGWNLYDGQDWAMFKPNELYKTGLIQTTADGNSKALYAAWKIKDNYKIMYNVNGGGTSTTPNGNVFKGEDYEVTTDVPTYAGYSFLNWNTAPNGSGTTYESGAKISGVTEDITLYAQWQENNSVTYNTNGGTTNTSLKILKPAKGDVVNLDFDTVVQKSGYTFVGWDENQYGNDGTMEKPTKEATYTKGGTTSFVMGDESVTLYAIWAPKQYEITYEAMSDEQGQRYTQNEKPATYYHLEDYTFDVRVDTSKWGTNEMQVSINNNSISIPTPERDTENNNIAIYTFTIKGATGNQAIKIGGLTARSYNVSLDAKGGTIDPTKNVTYYVTGESKVLPTEEYVTRTGYTFDDWYDDVSESGECRGTIVTQISNTETGDKKYYANWKANYYTVEYDANGGTGAPSRDEDNAIYDANYKIANQGSMYYTADPTVDFLGWSTNQNATEPEYLGDELVKNLADGEKVESVTLYAVWDVPKYTINYMLGGGTADSSGYIEPDKVKTGTSADIKFPEMEKTGYKFVGWSETAGSETADYISGGPKTSIDSVTNNYTLYAVWEPAEYSIKFINPKDTSDETKTKTQSGIKYGESVKLNANEFNSQETEYTEFLGWATTESAATVTRVPQYLDEQNVMNLSATDGDLVKLYAVWGNAPVKYLNYDANGGTYDNGAPEVQAASNDMAVVQFNTVPTMQGYTFLGWKTLDGTHTYTEDMQTDALTVDLKDSNVTLYANWDAKKYTVIYKANNGGTDEDTKQDIKYDESTRLEANAFEYKHHTFLGWSEDENATAPTYLDNQSVLNLPVHELEGADESDKSKGIILYAVWQAESPIYLTYNANGGTGAPASQSMYAGEDVTLSGGLPTREGYTFKGWATTSTAQEKGYDAAATIEAGFKTSTTLYAVWEKKEAHYVTYNENGGNGSVPIDSTGYYEDDEVTVRFNPIPMKTGYTFSGWSEGDRDNVKYPYSESGGAQTLTMGTTDVTLKAQWTPNTYTIIFKNDTVSKSQENVKYDAETKLDLNTFTAATAGYEFAGWATSAGGNVVYNDGDKVEKLTGAKNGTVTLYAVWTPKTVTITFDQQKGTSGTESVEVTYDQPMPSSVKSPVREGYNFGGYYSDSDCKGTQYYDEYMNGQKNADFTVNTTLYAKWEEKQYKVIYMQGAYSLQTDELKYGNTTTIRNDSLISEMPAGMKLAGWSTTDGGSVNYTADQKEVDLWEEGHGSDVVLYAIFKKDVKYTVTYIPGYGNTFPVDENLYEDNDIVNVELTENQPAQYGYTFLGWSDKPNQTTATYSVDGMTQFPIHADTKLYGVWKGGTYKVTYDGNGGEESFGEVANANVLGNVEMLSYTFSHPTDIYTKTGYSLLGWAQSAAKANLGQIDFAKGQTINPDLTTKAGDEITLYAVWQANKYTVKFDTNDKDAKVSETEREVTYGQKYGSVFPTPTLSGRVFQGWFTKAEDGEQVKNTDTVEITSTQTLYAHWNTVQYEITKQENGAGTIELKKPDATGESLEALSSTKADAGTLITVTVTPNKDYTIDNVTLYVDGTPVSMTGDGNDTYSFTLNKDTTVALKANGKTGAKYTVKYDANAGNEKVDSIEDSEFVVGKTATLSNGSAFKRTGYTLTGWNTSANGNGTAYGLGTEQTTALTQTAGGEVTLYAQWSANNYTVTFDAGEGAQLSETTKDVTFGKAYGTLPTPTKTDSVFDGWYSDEDCTDGNKVTNATIANKAEAHTLYAKWISAEYTITKNDNGVGNIKVEKPGVEDAKVEAGDKEAANTNITVTVTPRDGNYTIDNVKLYVNGSPVAMTKAKDGASGTYEFELKKNTEIALEENSNIGIKYTVVYNSNGGTDKDGDVTSVNAVTGEAFTLAGEVFAKDGSTLGGWNTVQGGTGKAYSLGETVKDLTLEPGGTVTLYAQWAENDPQGYEYTINYEPNGGEGTAYKQTMHQNRLNVALYDGEGFSRGKYALAGWATTPDGGVAYQLGDKLTAPLASLGGVTANLYAVWVKDAVRVTLNDTHNVNTVKSLILKTGSTYANLPVLSDSGYTFDGWFTDAVGGTRIDNTTEVTATSDHKLYAHWTAQAEKTYKVTVMKNDELGSITLSPKKDAYAAGDEVSVTVVSAAAEAKEVKLISSVDGEINLDGYSGTFNVKKDTTLVLVDAATATIDPVDEDKATSAWYIFYNGNGGEGSMDVQTVVKNKANAEKSTFSRDGYTFTGWKDGSNTSYEEGVEITEPITGNVVNLYAQWEATAENTYTVTFDAQGGEMTEAVTRTYHAGDKYGALPTPTKSGDWNFAGWYRDGAYTDRVYNTSEIVAKNHTLYAKWVSLTSVAITATGYEGEYDGSVHALQATPTKTLTGATYQWFKDGVAVDGANGKTYYVKNVADSGNYTCVVSGSYNGVEYKNLESTTAVVKITKGELTVSAADATVFYGSEAPKYAFSYSGFVASDDASVLKGAAKAVCEYMNGATNSGTYEIGVDTTELTADNYNIKTVGGTLTVKQLPVSLEWSGTKLEYNEAEQSIDATVKNAVGDDTFELTYEGNTGTDVGSYGAEVKSLGNENYTLTGATGVKHNWVIYAQGLNPNDPEQVPDPVQPEEKAEDVVVMKITLDPIEKTVNVGEEFTMIHQLQPEGVSGAIAGVLYASSNNRIATVDLDGKVTGVASGTAVITATTTSGLTSTCTVTVKAAADPDANVPVTGLTIKYNSYTLTQSGANFNLGAKVVPEDATDKGITYTTTNKAVATVDADGKVTAVSNGTANIFAVTNDGNYSRFCAVTVAISGGGSGGSGSSGGSGGGSGGSGGGGGSATTNYTITASAGNNGAISPNGSVSVKSGSDKAFTITPDNGYVVADVIVDGKSVGAVNTYVFSDVTGAHSISATFKAAGVTEVADPSETGVDKWLRVTEHSAYMKGYDNGLFGPTDNLTRAQAAQLFYNLLLNKDVDITVNFADVAGDAWYGKAVNTLASLGIIKGVGGDAFAPDRIITRAEFTAIAMRFANASAKVNNPFTDISTSDWFYGAVSGAVSFGWIAGYNDGSFRPNDTITRAEVVTIVNRMLARSADRGFVDGNEVVRFSDVGSGAWYYYQVMEAANGHGHRYSEDGQESWTGLNK